MEKIKIELAREDWVLVLTALNSKNYVQKQYNEIWEQVYVGAKNAPAREVSK